MSETRSYCCSLTGIYRRNGFSLNRVPFAHILKESAMRKIAMLLAAPMALFGNPVFAQQAEPEVEIVSLQAHPSDVDIGKPKTWVKPNVDPYSGDIDGASFLGQVTDIRPLELREAWNMRIRGECHRYQFGKKDVFRTTFGTNRSMLAQPGFTGMADVCIVRADGTAIVFPDDCKNIGPALAVIRREEPSLAKQEDTKVLSVPVITTVVGPPAPEAGFQMNPLFFGIPLPNYAGGSVNITTRSQAGSTASAKTNGTCNSCATNPDHRP
jgi:hypothetical protein